MRYLLILLLLTLATCGNVHHELPKTSASDPVWPLNPDKWAGNTNDLKGHR